MPLNELRKNIRTLQQKYDSVIDLNTDSIMRFMENNNISLYGRPPRVDNSGSIERGIPTDIDAISRLMRNINR